MKTFLLIFIFALSLKAESFYNNRCVDSFWFKDYQSSSPYVIFSRTPNTVEVLTSSTVPTLVSNMDKFKYNPITNECHAVMTKSNNTLGMTNEQYAFLSSLIGVLVGFVILFFSIFLTIKVGSKNA